MKDAVKRGTELAVTKFANVPDKAIIYARHLCAKYGMCGEIFVSAYSTYAQIEEGCFTDDDLYKLKDEHLKEYTLAQELYKIERAETLIKVVNK